jgi:hypothetical protein
MAANRLVWAMTTQRLRERVESFRILRVHEA